MIHEHTDRRSRRAVRAIVLVPAVAVALVLPAGPAHASRVTNASLVAKSQGRAVIAAPHAPAHSSGQRHGMTWGRKVG
jgi:hypothetical protein